MESYIQEDYVCNTVIDFEKFCDYIAANKPQTTKRGHLPRQACLEINQNSVHPYEMLKKNPFMDDYPSILLWFQLGLEMGLLEYNNDHKGKPTLEVSENYARYKVLNGFTKYFAFFSSWYFDLNHDSIYSDNIKREMDIFGGIGKFFEILCRWKDHCWIRRDDQFNRYKGTRDAQWFLQLLMKYYPQFLRHFMNLSWIECHEDVIAKDAYYGGGPGVAIQSMRITGLGLLMARASEKRHFSWVNKFNKSNFFLMSDSEKTEYYKTMKAIEKGKEGMLDPFIACFPPGSIDLDTLDSLFNTSHMDKPAAAYDFRLTHGRNFSCVIRCSSLHTFEDLHYAIQDALNFDNDHLYSFFLDGKQYSNNCVNCPDAHKYDSPTTDAYTLADARLRNKQQILYLFDYGDQWEFKLTVTFAGESTEVPDTPVILKTKGEPPEQYPSWDEE